MGFLILTKDNNQVLPRGSEVFVKVFTDCVARWVCIWATRLGLIKKPTGLYMFFAMLHSAHVVKGPGFIMAQ